MQRTVTITVAALAISRSLALDCTARPIVESQAYSGCQATTKIDFTVVGKTALVDPAAFCGSPDCDSLWSLLQRLGTLQCLQRYNAGNYTLKDETSAQSCFKTYAKTPSSPAVSSVSEAVMPAPMSTAATQTPVAITTHTEPTTTAETRGTNSEATPSAPEPKAPSSMAVSTTPSSERTTTAATMTNSVVPQTSSLQAIAATASKGGGGSDGSNHSQPNLESATIGTTGAQSSESGRKPGPPESSVASKANSELQGTSLSAVWITLASCGGGVVLLVMLSVYIHRRKAAALEAKVLECLDRSGDYMQTTLRTSRSRSPVRRNEPRASDQIQWPTQPAPKLLCMDDDIIIAVRIPFGKLTVGSLVSRGGFGEVYRGMYRNKVVAIKRLLPEKRNDVYQIENFLDEIKLMASLEHDHIVQFVGVAWETLDDLCCVTEFLALGDLRTLLAKYDLDADAHRKGFTVDKVKIALHVAKALTYMHSLEPNVLHRDIKSRNILLDANLDAKVTDFGVSRERAESTMTTGVGSTLWMAPEVMSGGRYNEKADIYSFGVVLSELDTHRIPYSHVVEPSRGRRLPDTVIVQMMMMHRISVQFTHEETSAMAQLGRRCVQLDPSKRPSAKEVEDFIHAQWSDVVIAL